MKTYFKLAWRNLWRNKRRTAITAASIFFGVFFSVMLSSVQQGSLNNMVENLVRFYSGYLQIQDSSFRDNPSVNYALEFDEDLDTKIRSCKDISMYTQRVESYSLASSGEISRGTAVFGIQPGIEDEISSLSKWIDQGEFLKPGDKGVMLGKTLAENLELNLYDTLILLGQGYHGTTAAGKYPIHGILDFPLLDMNTGIVYMDLEACRELFSIPGKSTSIVIMVDNKRKVDALATELRGKINTDLQVYTWDVLLEEMQNLVEGKAASGKIIKAILFMIIGFGIWGTIIMMMAEREREFGIMIALGIRKVRLAIILLIETFFIGLMGLLTGFILTFPIVWYLFNNPIHVTGDVAETYKTMGFEPVIKFAMEPEIFLSPAITVFTLFALIFIYPLFYLKRLKTANALRA